MNDEQFEAYLAHVIGCAAAWAPGSGAHPPALVQASQELRDYFYERCPTKAAIPEPPPPPPPPPMRYIKEGVRILGYEESEALRIRDALRRGG